MATFVYKALSSNGDVSAGDVSAVDRSEALKILNKRGLQPMSLKESSSAEKPAKKSAEKAKGKTGKQSSKKSKTDAVDTKKKKSKEGTTKLSEGPIKLKRNDIVLFTEELSEMLAAGLQLEPALKAMESRQELGNLKDVSQRVRQLVRDGSNFSTALQRVSPSFGPLYCSLAAAGEASGALPTILKRQAHYLRTLQELQGKIALALIYPAFLVLSGIGVGIIFVTKLIPQLTSLIQNAPGKQLPLGVQIMMGTSDFFVKWWVVIVIVIVAALVLFKAWKDKEENKPVWDEAEIKLPMYGRVVESRFYVQFLETLANLVGNGLPLLRALELTRDATMNLFYRSSLTKVIALIGDGRSLSRAMISVGVFPPLLIDMITVGEQTGKLDEALRRAADRYDKELNAGLQKIMALIMPIVLITMAVLIGSMAYLMITAIFQTISDLGPKR